MRVSEPRRYAHAAALALILLAAAGLRLWGIRNGLPYAYNLDERAHFVPHAVAMTGGDLNPGYFINPPAFTYLLAAWLGVLHLGGDVQQLFADDPTRVFLDARVLTLLLSVGAVAATYAAGRAFFGRGAGLARRRGDGGRVPAGLLLAPGAQRRAGRAAVRSRDVGRGGDPARRRAPRVRGWAARASAWPRR